MCIAGELLYICMQEYMLIISTCMSYTLSCAKGVFVNGPAILESSAISADLGKHVSFVCLMYTTLQTNVSSDSALCMVAIGCSRVYYVINPFRIAILKLDHNYMATVYFLHTFLYTILIHVEYRGY